MMKVLYILGIPLIFYHKLVSPIHALNKKGI